MNNDLASILKLYPWGGICVAILISTILSKSLPEKSNFKLWLYSFAIFLILFWIIELIQSIPINSRINVHAIIPISMSILVISIIGFFLSITIFKRKIKSLKPVENKQDASEKKFLNQCIHCGYKAEVDFEFCPQCNQNNEGLILGDVKKH